MPPPPPSHFQHPEDLSGPPLMLGYRVPLGALATLLSFCEASDALGICSRVCKWFQVAALHSSAWPTLKIRSGAAEQSIDSLCSILMSISTGLQLLTLDLTFQQRDLGVALPGELILRHLQRLELKLNDSEANIFACDLLGCIESPQLRDVKIMAPLTPQLLNAISMTLLPTNGKLNSLKLTALPSRNMEVLLDTGTLTALQELLEITPELSKLMISLEDPSGGLSRYFETDVYDGTLQNLMAMSHLKHLSFDFLSDPWRTGFLNGNLCGPKKQICVKTNETAELHKIVSKSWWYWHMMAILNYKGKLKDAVNHFEWFWYILKCLDFIYRYFLNSHLVVSNLTWRLFHQKMVFYNTNPYYGHICLFSGGLFEWNRLLSLMNLPYPAGFKGVIGLFRVPPEDDLIAFILQSDDRAWHLESARFSGCKRCLGDPDQTLVTLLSKLSNDLQELLCFGKRFQCVLWILWWGCRFWMCFAWLLNSAACASPNNAKDTKYEYHVCTSRTCILYLCWNCTSFASTSLPLVGLQVCLIDWLGTVPSFLFLGPATSTPWRLTQHLAASRKLEELGIDAGLSSWSHQIWDV